LSAGCWTVDTMVGAEYVLSISQGYTICDVYMYAYVRERRFRM
jgi:hypothetical protein